MILLWRFKTSKFKVTYKSSRVLDNSPIKLGKHPSKGHVTLTIITRSNSDQHRTLWQVLQSPVNKDAKLSIFSGKDNHGCSFFYIFCCLCVCVSPGVIMSNKLSQNIWGRLILLETNSGLD